MCLAILACKYLHSWIIWRGRVILNTRSAFDLTRHLDLISDVSYVKVGTAIALRSNVINLERVLSWYNGKGKRDMESFAIPTLATAIE